MDLSSFLRPSAPARFPRLPRSSVTAALAVCLAACDDPQPPVACETIPSQTLHVGESRTVGICFEDPNMDKITLAAVSSDSNVAEAALRGEVIGLRGVSTGTARVTVTATDPGGLTGTAGFEVLVPNRPPEIVQMFSPMRLLTGGLARWDLSEYFREPDGQTMTYSAVSSDDAVASPSVSGNALSVVAGRAGVATITVTATDAGGLTASQELEVTVVEPVRLLRDDFDSNESLDDWLFTGTRRRVVDGKLVMTTNTRNTPAWARTPLSATDWEVTAVMGNDTEDSWAQILMFTTHVRYTGYIFQVGLDTTGTWDDITGESGTNYRLLVWDGQEQVWTAPPNTYGTSNAVKGVGDLMEVAFSARNGEFTATVEGEELFRIPRGPYPDEVAILTLGVWPVDTTVGKVGVFDWVEVYGLEPG